MWMTYQLALSLAARLFPMSFPFSRSKSHQMRFFHPHLAPPASSPGQQGNPFLAT